MLVTLVAASSEAEIKTKTASPLLHLSWQFMKTLPLRGNFWPCNMALPWHMICLPWFAQGGKSPTYWATLTVLAWDLPFPGNENTPVTQVYYDAFRHRWKYAEFPAAYHLLENNPCHPSVCLCVCPSVRVCVNVLICMCPCIRCTCMYIYVYVEVRGWSHVSVFSPSGFLEERFLIKAGACQFG